MVDRRERALKQQAVHQPPSWAPETSCSGCAALKSSYEVFGLQPSGDGSLLLSRDPSTALPCSIT